MSDEKPPGGRIDRTIIQPNPGGRRAPPAQSPVPPQQPAPPPQYPPQGYPAAPYSSPPAGNYPAPPPAPGYPPAPPPAYAPPGGGAVDWAGSHEPVQRAPAQQVASPQPGQAMILKRDVPVAPNENILLETAGPMLLLFGRLRASLMHARFADLMDQVASAIESFDKTARGAGVDAETVKNATYALAATADDIVQNIPSEDRRIWTQYSMLSRFFGERIGGVRFFELLDRAKADPHNNFDLLELMFVCLTIGFQGIHRTSQGGAAALQSIQRNLYETLRRVRSRTELDISPHWQGQDIPPPSMGFRVPLWSIAAVSALVLAGVYIVLRLLVAGSSETVASEIRKLVPMDTISLARRAPVAPPPPPPPSQQIDCFKTALAEEIESGRITALETPNAIILRVGAFASFASGKAEVLEAFKPVAVRMGSILDKQKGQVRIVGHTDNVPITSARFPSNYHLSVARAQSVAALVKSAFADPARVVVEGKGSDQPIAAENTNEGRARNRRVDLIIPRDAEMQSCPQ